MTDTRRQPEEAALYQVMREHLLTFEQQWTDEASGRRLPRLVTEELHPYLDCGLLGRGCAHLYCEECGEHRVVAFSCKARAVCPSCLGRRTSEGAANLVDHVLPDVPTRQFAVTNLRSQIVPQPPTEATTTEKPEKPARRLMHLTSESPALHPARPLRASGRVMTNAEDWVS